jgi:beta-glucosidase/6-phospho-beta-glucosidase/beta-galactosidase
LHRGTQRAGLAAPQSASVKFMFATGIEGSYPTIRTRDGSRRRVDEFAVCGHYERWRDDFALVEQLGIDFLRYGPPLFRAHAGPGRYDWSFADETFAELRRLGITPIADLCHFGVPDWIGDFQNDDWPEYFAEYARAFARRFPWVRFFTPVNEIFIAATFSAQYGWWNECAADDRSFVTALHNLCRANLLAMHAILAERDDAVFIQSESSEYFHAESPDARTPAGFLNEKRFLPLDLTYGHSLDVTMYEYVLDNGMTRAQFHWFRDNHVVGRCIMGNDYYVTNEHLVRADGRLDPAGEIFGYYVITHQYYERYRLPVMHTETNLPDAALAPAWLHKQWANVHRLKQDGVPVLGFTWYSLTDQVDWDSTLREDAGRVNPLGLADLDRSVRPVGEAYRSLIRQWRDVLPSEAYSLDLRLS